MHTLTLTFTKRGDGTIPVPLLVYGPSVVWYVWHWLWEGRRPMQRYVYVWRGTILATVAKSYLSY